MKPVLQLFLIIIIIQVIVFLLGIPEYIPNLEPTINWSIFYTYIFILLLFITMVVVMIVQYARAKKRFKEWLKPIGICILSLIGIFFGMVVALGYTEGGLFNTHQYVKSYTYKNADATVYIYDESFLDPAFCVSVRNGTFPIVKEIYRSRNEILEDKVFFDTTKDCLYIYGYKDTLCIDSKQIMKY